MAIGKQGSADFGVLLVDGYNLLSAKVKGWPYEVEVELEQTNGLGDSWPEHTPTGMRTASISQEGAFFDTNANAIHVAMKDTPLTERLAAWAVAGNAIGALFTACKGAFSVAYGVLAENAKLTKANVKYAVTGQVDEGVILQEHEAKTADWNTKTEGVPVDFTLDPSQQVIPITSWTLASPSLVTTPVPHGRVTGDIVLISGAGDISGSRTITVVNATQFTTGSASATGGTGGSFVRANSANGGVGYQFVSALSGFTGFVGKIRDSADDVTYADLITFSNVTGAPAAERLTVAGVVDRYLSYDGNVTGSGSITPFVGFKRNA